MRGIEKKTKKNIVLTHSTLTITVYGLFKGKTHACALLLNAGFSLAHKNVHFDLFLPQMTPKTVHRLTEGIVMSPKFTINRNVSVSRSKHGKCPPIS